MDVTAGQDPDCQVPRKNDTMATSRAPAQPRDRHRGVRCSRRRRARNRHRPPIPDQHAHAERRQPPSTYSEGMARNTWDLPDGGQTVRDDAPKVHLRRLSPSMSPARLRTRVWWEMVAAVSGRSWLAGWRSYAQGTVLRHPIHWELWTSP